MKYHKDSIDKIDFWTIALDFFIGILTTVISALTFGAQVSPVVGFCAIIIIACKNILYFSIKKHIENRTDNIKNRLDILTDTIQYETAMKLYLEIPEQLKPFGRTHLKTFESNIKKLKEEQRTGELSQASYYEYLTGYVRNLKKEDKIWALSSFLDSEWDDNNQFEAALMNEFLLADDRGVETVRLYIFHDESIFKCDENNIESFNSLKLLLPYLQDNSYVNTTSYAINRDTYLSLDEDQKKILGLGFCAFDLHEQDDVLVRDVCADLGNTQEIRGELVFNPEMIHSIKQIFHIYAKETFLLKQYVKSKCNAAGKQFLRDNGVSI